VAPLAELYADSFGKRPGKTVRGPFARAVEILLNAAGLAPVTEPVLIDELAKLYPPAD
jgi:hypothetical protein